MPIKIMSINARRDLKSDGIHAWAYRKEAIAKLISNEAAVIVGMQEMLPHMMKDLMAYLPEYEMIGKERASGDEASPVLVRRHVADIIENKTFWLSHTPHVEQSKHPDAAFPRVATEVILRIEDETLCVINTHLDHVGHKAKRDGIGIILEHRSYPKLPTIIMGDFNAPPEDSLHGTMRHAGMIRTNPTLAIATHHRFLGKYMGGPIDFIYHDRHFSCIASGVIRSSSEKYLSDHDPVWATLSINK